MTSTTAGAASDEPSASTGTVIMVLAGMAGVIALIAGVLIWGNAGAGKASVVPATPAASLPIARLKDVAGLGQSPDDALYGVGVAGLLGPGCTVSVLDAESSRDAVRVRVLKCSRTVVTGAYDPRTGTRPTGEQVYDGFIGWVRRSALDLKP